MHSTATARRISLHDVANIQAGYLSRGRIAAIPDGSHRLIQAKDVSQSSGVQAGTAIRFDPERNPDVYEVTRGDILLVARGNIHDAHLIIAELKNTLASSIFHIIRPKKDVVLPAYLAWWLNQPDAQAEIHAAAGGTGISYLSRPAVERLQVTCPPRTVQDRIVKTLDLWKRQKAIQAAIDLRRENMIQFLCRRLLSPTGD